MAISRSIPVAPRTLVSPSTLFLVSAELVEAGDGEGEGLGDGDGDGLTDGDGLADGLGETLGEGLADGLGSGDCANVRPVDKITRIAKVSRKVNFFIGHILP